MGVVVVGIYEFLIVSIVSTTCLINVCLGFNPVDNYLIDCGSSTNTSVGDRVFLADGSSFLSTPQTIFVNTSSAISSISGSALYQTARVFNGTSTYKFPIKKHGLHSIRLHFYPFDHQTHNLSKSKFSVSAQTFTLLEHFQPQKASVVKEYTLNIASDDLVLTFTPSTDSFAFLNALEISSLPDGLYPDGARIVDLPGTSQDLVSRGMETMARANMGNQTVLPQNDTLHRLWVSDITYLNHVNLVTFVSKVSRVKSVNVSKEWPSEDIAPSLVYGTATRLNSDPGPSTKINVTWLFPVDPGFEYFLRFHFCDIVSRAPGQLFFNVYINSWMAARNLDLSNLTGNILGTPYYMDVVARSLESPQLSVSIEPSSVGNPNPDGILNGIEIMKLSNSKSSLGSVDADETSGSKKKVLVIVIVGVATGVLLIAVITVSLLMFLRRKKKNASLVGHSGEDPTAVHGGGGSKLFANGVVSRSRVGYRFPFVEIKEATGDFSGDRLVGEGGFGKVYKGVLRDGAEVAVKRGLTGSRQGFIEFQTELEMLSQFRHRHLVSLIGYCHEDDEMIIVYEFMENGTLKDHLYGSGLQTLSWRQRLEICVGAARGLHYLHTGPKKPIIHRDVKSANILLDENLMAKVADFGLSKTGPEIDQTHVSTAVKGSFGYLDPEYLTMQQLTEKSDVYSFGVVMLETLCGRAVIDPSREREAVNLIEWVMKECEKGGELAELMDPRVKDEAKPDCLRKFGEVALKCLAKHGVDRPSMGDVLWKLECALQVQGNDDGRVDVNGDVVDAAGGVEAAGGDSTTQFQFHVAGSSMSDLDGVSMGRVFSEMVKKAEIRHGKNKQ